MKIEILAIEGLQGLLAEKIKKQLSKAEKETIENRISAHYKLQYPNLKETYYHNMFCAAIVHPDKKTVIPLAPEPIIKTDGSKKNDCGTPRGVYQLGVQVPAGKQHLMHPVSSFELMEATT